MQSGPAAEGAEAEPIDLDAAVDAPMAHSRERFIDSYRPFQKRAQNHSILLLPSAQACSMMLNLAAERAAREPQILWPKLAAGAQPEPRPARAE